MPILYSDDCPFCRIAKGEEGGFTYVTHEDIISKSTHFTSFIGASRYNDIPFKILVIPNQHFSTFQKLPKEYGIEFLQTVQLISQAMILTTNSLGTFNWFQNGLKIQDISHFHFHIIPRFDNDNFLQSLEKRTPLSTSERKSWTEKIRSNLNSI